MPSGQMQNGSNAQSNSVLLNKQPPNKPPPPPPPPKSNAIASNVGGGYPPPLPPPPPRNSSQASSIGSFQVAGNSNVLTNSIGPASLNNGSSISSINSIGRSSACNHVQSTNSILNNPQQNSMSVVPMIHGCHMNIINNSGGNNGIIRGYNKHCDNCTSSKSSISSHTSIQHNHHYHTTSHLPNNLMVNNSNSSCNHQNNANSLSDSGSCNLNFDSEARNTFVPPPPFNNSNGSSSSNNCCSNNSHFHVHNPSLKCSIQNSINSTSSGGGGTAGAVVGADGGSNMRQANNISNNNNSSSNATTTIGRNSLLFNPNNNSSSVDLIQNSCNNVEPCKNCQPFLNHHHHHHHHNVPLSSSSSLSSLQLVDHHRCNLAQTSLTAQSISGGDLAPTQRCTPLPPCAHVHRPHSCSHNQQQQGNFCDHHHNPLMQPCQQVASHDHGNCSHSHGSENGSSIVVPTSSSTTHHNCNDSSLLSANCGVGGIVTKTCQSGNVHHHHHHHPHPHLHTHPHPHVHAHPHIHPQELVMTNRSDVSNNDSLLSTAHTHNLSNSSTTTHTSNVAVRHQPQFHRPVLSRGARSNSSQQYEQYGQSSAASTSSATASLSHYHMPPNFEDMVPLYPSSKLNQPLPPTPISSADATNFGNLNFKSRPQSPSQLFLLNNNNVNNNMTSVPKQNNAFNNVMNNQIHQQSQSTAFTNSQHHSANMLPPLFPPLRPKPLSPNLPPSSSSSLQSSAQQITTVRTSPSLQNEPITRVTSQAGVQNPLPNSDSPPPLPPLNTPGSRTQPIVNSLISRIQSSQQSLNTLGQQQQQHQHSPSINPIPNFMNLSLTSNNNNNNNNISADIERKTEALTRQVELELEQQQKSGEPHGICPKCGKNVMPAQEACKAMNQIYHASCFVCCECNRTLLGKTFYPVGDKVYCEEDFKYNGHMQSLEKCSACNQPIFNMILQSMGKSYHPKCFKCCVCGQCLDGVPFTIDGEKRIYCVKDYHKIYSPICAACGNSISPIDGTGETVRVVSNNKDYHIDCYCCEDCGLQLTDEEPSQSYPLDNHLLCQQCHIKRLENLKTVLVS